MLVSVVLALSELLEAFVGRMSITLHSLHPLHTVHSLHALHPRPSRTATRATRLLQNGADAYGLTAARSPIEQDGY